MTEPVLPGAAVLVPEEVEERVVQEREEWVAPEQARVQKENVCVQNAEPPLLMRSERPVILRNVPNAAQQWSGDNTRFVGENSFGTQIDPLPYDLR